MSLDLSDRAARIPFLLDEASRGRARARLGELHAPPGSFGRLGELAAWMAAVQGRCPTAALTRVRLVYFAGDHGIAAGNVSAQPLTATPGRVRDLLGAGSAAVLADLTATGVRVVDVAVDADARRLPPQVRGHRIRRGSGRIDVEDALTRAEAEAAFGVGVSVADDEVDQGADLLVAAGVGVASSTTAATLLAVLTGKEVAAVVGRGSGVDDRGWIRKRAAAPARCTPRATGARRRRRHDRPARGRGGADFAALAGFVSQSAVRRTPLVLDGLVSTAAAAVAHRIGEAHPAVVGRRTHVCRPWARRAARHAEVEAPGHLRDRPRRRHGGAARRPPPASGCRVARWPRHRGHGVTTLTSRVTPRASKAGRTAAVSHRTAPPDREHRRRPVRRPLPRQAAAQARCPSAGSVRTCPTSPGRRRSRRR